MYPMTGLLIKVKNADVLKRSEDGIQVGRDLHTSKPSGPLSVYKV